MRPEFIRTSLKKMWIEDFALFCENNLSGESKEWMRDLINFEADFKTI